ncbi:uncharacterized protein PG986_003607 [Apiospora aurea]|uniref:Uncharacterized protein n=1 Tax=Apiospora aurea TaxID=335848 RepID=A0ABR1QS56_9PEZI
MENNMPGFEVTGWAKIAAQRGLSEAAAKIRFGVVERRYREATDGVIPPVPVIKRRRRRAKKADPVDNLDVESPEPEPVPEDLGGDEEDFNNDENVPSVYTAAPSAVLPRPARAPRRVIRRSRRVRGAQVSRDEDLDAQDDGGDIPSIAATQPQQQPARATRSRPARRTRDEVQADNDGGHSVFPSAAPAPAAAPVAATAAPAAAPAQTSMNTRATPSTNPNANSSSSRLRPHEGGRPLWREQALPSKPDEDLKLIMANFQHPEFSVENRAKIAAKQGMTKDTGQQQFADIKDRYETITKRRRRRGTKPATDPDPKIEENEGEIDDGENIPSVHTAHPGPPTPAAATSPARRGTRRNTSRAAAPELDDGGEDVGSGVAAATAAPEGTRRATIHSAPEPDRQIWAGRSNVRSHNTAEAQSNPFPNPSVAAFRAMLRHEEQESLRRVRVREQFGREEEAIRRQCGLPSVDEEDAILEEEEDVED